MTNLTTTASLRHLQSLVAFPSISLQPNTALIAYVEELLNTHGIQTERFEDPQDPTRTNLFASVGPSHEPGVLLSGHTDVVPTQGQPWDSDPFILTAQGNKLVGRGTADMKGFIACALTAICHASTQPLQRPLQLALSFDEEIGCVGVRHMLKALEHKTTAPFLCIVGEPTLMQIGTGHKGKSVYRAQCNGQAGHSGLAPLFSNAIHTASDLVSALREVQQEIAQHGSTDAGYSVPYTTVHVGVIQGGTALNIVPSTCTVDFEVRHISQDDPDDILQRILHKLTQRMATNESTALPGSPAVQAPDIALTNSYPSLDTPNTAPAVQLLTKLLPSNTATTKVDYGTEGGLFQQSWRTTPVLVCGPGSITVAHKANEYVETEQLQACDKMLNGLIDFLCQPQEEATRASASTLAA